MLIVCTVMEGLVNLKEIGEGGSNRIGSEDITLSLFANIVKLLGKPINQQENKMIRVNKKV